MSRPTSIEIAGFALIIMVTSTLSPDVSAARAQLPGGLLGTMGATVVPGLGGASTNNLTGVLSYCIKNKLVSGAGGASGLLAQLAGRPGVDASPDYKAGLVGTLLNGGKPSPSAGAGNAASMLGGLTGAGASTKELSLDSLPVGLRNKLCDTVLTQAKSLL